MTATPTGVLHVLLDRACRGVALTPDEGAALRAGIGQLRRTADGLQAVHGNCPACHSTSLFLGSGGHVTCSRIDCPDPGAVDDLLDQP